MAQTYLIKSSPTAGNRNKGTVSVWVKRSSLGSTQNIYTDFYSTDNFGGIRFNSDDRLGVFSYAGGSAQLDINTNRMFKDTNGWMHIVVAWDTTDGTSTDRIKIYINGERETSFTGSPTYPSSSQDLIFGIGGSYPIVIGRRGTDNNEYFDGSMSHFHRVDNQALAPTVFGSTDSTTGEWKINTSPSITYTGSSDYNFFILKDGNSVTDQSGQSNNLTVGYGTLTKTEDCPSNVFCTMNALSKTNMNLVNGNTSSEYSSSSSWAGAASTLGMNGGKYYCEAKIKNNANQAVIQVCLASVNGASVSALDVNRVALNTGASSNNIFVSDLFSYTQQSVSPNASNGDIYAIAFDSDNGTVQFYRNGATYGTAITNSALQNRTFMFACQQLNTNLDWNFGNGYFGTTAVATNSGNGYAGAEGSSIFNYQPPTGYSALSTKGLNQ